MATTRNLLFVCLSTLIVSVPALAINKCEADGKISYSEAPCPSGKATVLASAPSPTAADVAQAKTIAAKEARTLKKIEAEKAKQEKLDANASKAAAKNSAKQAKQEKKCAQLAQKKRWADEALASASPKNQNKARTKAKQAAEKWDMECKNTNSMALQ